MAAHGLDGEGNAADVDDDDEGAKARWQRHQVLSSHRIFFEPKLNRFCAEG